MSFKPVTNAQLAQFGKMAGEKGVDCDRLQKFGYDNGLIALALDAILQGLPITVGVPNVAPPGCRIHTVKVKVRLDQPWGDAVNAAGPDTPSDYEVWKVIDLYPPTGTGVVEEELILLNYLKGDGSWDKALAWAEQSGLRKTDPRRVFAIGKDHPNFHKDVGINGTYVVATESCACDGGAQACGVWWGGSGRGAGLGGVGGFGGAGGWFAFRK